MIEDKIYVENVFLMGFALTKRSFGAAVCIYRYQYGMAMDTSCAGTYSNSLGKHIVNVYRLYAIFDNSLS